MGSKTPKKHGLKFLIQYTIIVSQNTTKIYCTVIVYNVYKTTTFFGPLFCRPSTGCAN
jgi:hypothetical protein